ncbi:hypothetical protein [Micrococcus endophyticus]|uniref:Uncharacterized protein n=1 Tax=Micrococcus endophyticus TaxID=455343 RepID=A0A7W9JL02_9MICC|nr:hypothetical protein [Micrococcus endophyticus]MBB5849873.1 hypothetical protein [Micrococcus endophyticus]
MRSAVDAAPHASGRPHPAPGRVVRGPARLARGVAGALAMTVLAALFHAAAVPGVGLPDVRVAAFAAVLAAPVCTALAGRALSLWRTAAAVGVAQGLFHVLYGIAAGGHAVTPAAGVDPAHLHHAAAAAGPLVSVSAGPAAGHVHAADPLMLAAHAAAAVLTVLVLRRGEALVLAVAERVLQAVLPRAASAGPLPLPSPARVPALPAPRPTESLVLLGTPGRRGPPFALAA